MKEFKLSKEKTARVWLNEWPIDAKHSSNITNNDILTAQCQGSLKCINNSVVVELLVPLGGKFNYGMLGVMAFGEMSFNPTIELCTPLSLSTSTTLADSIDTIEPYISEEYRKSILKGGIESAKEYFNRPSVIRYFGGQQGVFGSSQSAFEKLAFICLRLLSTSKYNILKDLEDALHCRQPEP